MNNLIVPRQEQRQGTEEYYTTVQTHQRLSPVLRSVVISGGRKGEGTITTKSLNFLSLIQLEETEVIIIIHPLLIWELNGGTDWLCI